KGRIVEADQVYEATLSFLYKLLFLFYAEARHLLPMDGDYHEYSLMNLAQGIAEKIDSNQVFSSKAFIFYQQLIDLFNIIDQGDRLLNVPVYNGGLFHFSNGNLEINAKFEPNDFLLKYRLSDAVLAPVIDKLARFEGQAIDYSFLGVRQLGSIYEGLLEYRLIIDDVSQGLVHLENDKGERKASGSYYTPDYIVKYIVSHTIQPILDEREQQFKELMAQVSDLYQQKNDKRLSLESLKDIDRRLSILERQAQTILLDIKVCDPAMGSGHFLVETVDYLTDKLIKIINLYGEYNPILKSLREIRQGILDNLQRQGITIAVSALDDDKLLKRVVMKRCIYGVDLNPMAVELAKVSLWLHSFTIGAPLSFLGHHLRCGNSLIGTTAKEAELAMSQEKNGNAVQFNLLTGPFVGLLRAAEVMRGVSVLSDATFAEVEQSERLFKQFDEAAKPFKQLLDIYVSQFFGVKQAKNLLERLGEQLINVEVTTLKQADQKIIEEAENVNQQKRFFHWDLEFPEVFIDLENANWAENPGFDAVIGNPPWGADFSSQDKSFLQSVFALEDLSNLDSYSIFTITAISHSKIDGYIGYIIPDTVLRKDDLKVLRKFLLQETSIHQLIETGSLFKEVRDTWCLILIISHTKPSLFQRIYHYQINRFIISSEERLASLQKQDWSQYHKSSQLYWQSRPSFIIGYLSARKEQKIIQKITKLSISLGDYPLNDYDKSKIIVIYWLLQRQYYRLTLIMLQDYKSYKLIISRGEEGSKFRLQNQPQEAFSMVLPESVERYSLHDHLKVAETSLTTNKVTRFYTHPKIWVIRIQKMRWKQRLITVFDGRHSSAGMKTLQVIISASDNVQFLLFISTQLNSKLMNFWCTDYLVDDMNQSYLERLPIRKINFTTEGDRRQQGLETLINLYQTYQTNFDLMPILDQCQQHLNQDPEEADIIHDFLAYLAEQMLELNRQKQTEMKGFLEWLESLIGCPIANLKNKSKIQNYLGDYAKQTTLDPALDLDGLINILNQNKKLIKIDPSSRQGHTRLKTEYQNSLNILMPLKTQLKNCDRLIDEIVYQLYGLTPEEKAIIENSTAK
ncbi:MAG: Eco57I restriction-modification methylase domain-containing protein, partial [Microcystaceae cyanobacterium]